MNGREVSSKEMVSIVEQYWYRIIWLEKEEEETGNVFIYSNKSRGIEDIEIGIHRKT